MPQVLQAILSKDPEPIRRRAPETPAALAAVAERALSKSPAARFRDAGDMGRALARAGETLTGETLAGAANDDADRTMLSGSGATVVVGMPGQPVAGANALDVGLAREAQRQRHDAPGTVRPERTVASGLETEVPSRARGVLIGAAALAVVAAAGAVLWLQLRPGSAQPPGGVTQETVGILTEALLTSKIELARADLDNRDYPAAAAHAREALAIDAANPEARAVLESAEDARRQLDTAAAEAAAAVERSDWTRASEALARVMALDPRHPVAEGLSGQLNRFFRGQAEESRSQATQARTGAEDGQSTGEPDFRRASSLSIEADGLFRERQYAVAARKYLEARDAYETAQRAALTRRAIASPAPPRATPAAPSPTPTLAQAPPAPSGATAPVPMAPAPGADPTPGPALAAAASVPTAALTASPSRDLQETAAVQRVIDEYVRAIETKDLALFRALMPELTSDQEKSLRDIVRRHQGAARRAVEFRRPGRGKPSDRACVPPGHRQRPSDEAGPADVPAGASGQHLADPLVRLRALERVVDPHHGRDVVLQSSVAE